MQNIKIEVLITPPLPLFQHSCCTVSLLLATVLFLLPSSPNAQKILLMPCQVSSAALWHCTDHNAMLYQLQRNTNEVGFSVMYLSDN